MNESMSLLKTSRKFHKWLMAFLGIQFFIWSVTGAYMVFFDIDYIHGDSLVKNSQEKIDPQQVNYSLQSLLRAYPQAQQISAGTFMGKAVYRFDFDEKKWLIDATDGEVLSPLDENAAIQAAIFYYSGKGDVSNASLITDNPPFELNPDVLPVWRINFVDLGAPTIYVSAQNGAMVGKRHDFWRLFDWMFRFHVMDYETGEDLNNSLLFWFTLFGILSCLSGLVLAYFRIFRSQQASLLQPTQSSDKNNSERL